jgi:hypothetical protein
LPAFLTALLLAWEDPLGRWPGAGTGLQQAPSKRNQEEVTFSLILLLLVKTFKACAFA